MKLTLEDLVSLTTGRIVRQGESTELTGMAALDEAGHEDVSFLGNEKYYQDFLQTKAGVILIPPGVPEDPAPPESATLIEVENPSHAFGEVVKKFVTAHSKFVPGIHPAAFVAEGVSLNPDKVSVKAGAIIESGVSIGDSTEIGAGVVVCEDVVIGENCVLHANSTVRERCVLGNHVTLQPGAVIGSDGYGYALVDGKHEKIDQVGIVVLEDHVDIGANSTVDRARFGRTVVGEGTKLDNLVQIGHNVRIGKHCLIVAQSGLAGSTHMGDYVTMAAQTGSVGHVKIHDRAVFTARAVASKDMKGDTVYMGMPARPIQEEQKKKAALARLPKLITQVRDLQKRVDEMEK
ncbi:UDP-3-O-acylglucosamine N-acyltransferase [Oceaniferula spumae]|uniref:UDP-3-O-acylglucosamine N-acyltransferase n=1 Tax=Oceaniferula spumae TaxID=2979115 RepID=A0AAT9FSJ5_9BACT